MQAVLTPRHDPKTPLHICIIGMIQPGGMAGGIEQAVYGTVGALGRLVDGDERYTVVVEPNAADWLDAVLGPNTRVTAYPRPAWRIRARQLFGLNTRFRPYTEKAYHLLTMTRFRMGNHVPSDASPDPFLESLGGDVFHFPYQWLVPTSKPSLFNPQDLQHLHHPEFFEKQYIEHRQARFTEWCATCSLLEVPSTSTKNDLVKLMGIEQQKVALVPKGPPTAFESSPIADPRQLLSRLKIPEEFMLFPATPSPHKNHIRLFEALASLRDNGNLRLNLVCTGGKNSYWPVLQKRIQELDLAEQVYFVNYIPTSQLKALYQMAEFTVFPTLFEGGGFPLLEAFYEGSPIACSDIPVLAEQAGTAALFFDPLSVSSIAEALRHIHFDPDLRSSLRERGFAVARHYTWDRTARTYRALYRTLASAPLTDEDRQLLQAALS